MTTENELPEEGTDLVYALSAAGGALFAARSSGLYHSADGGQTWQDALSGFNLSEPVPVLCLALSPQFERDGVAVAGSSGGVFRSADGGATWTAVLLPQPPPTVSALALSPRFAEDATIFAGTMEDGVFISTDGGGRWVAWNFGLLDLNVMCLAISPYFAEDETIFAGTESGIFRSTNGGRAWRDIELPFGFDAVVSLAVSPDFAQDHTLFAGTENHGLWVSRDEGDSWETVGSFEEPVNGVLLLKKPGLYEKPGIWGGEIIAVTSSGLWTSPDGAEWNNLLPEDLADEEITAAAMHGDHVLVGFVDGAVEAIPLI